jgi:hypothetical protein
MDRTKLSNIEPYLDSKLAVILEMLTNLEIKIASIVKTYDLI